MTETQRRELINIIIDACEAGREFRWLVSHCVRSELSTWNDQTLRNWFFAHIDGAEEYLKARKI